MVNKTYGMCGRSGKMVKNVKNIVGFVVGVEKLEDILCWLTFLSLCEKSSF